MDEEEENQDNTTLADDTTQEISTSKIDPTDFPQDIITSQTYRQTYEENVVTINRDLDAEVI